MTTNYQNTDAWPGRPITLSEAAAYLSLSEESVRKKLKRGELPGVKLGGEWRLLKAEIDRYLLQLSEEQQQQRAAQQQLTGTKQWDSRNAEMSGGSVSLLHPDSEYAAVLRLPTRNTRRNTKPA